MVETQLCKLRDTSDTLIGRACAMFHFGVSTVEYFCAHHISSSINSRLESKFEGLFEGKVRR